MIKEYVIDAVDNQSGYLAISLYPVRRADESEKYHWIPAQYLKLNLPATARNTQRYTLNKIIRVRLESTGRSYK